LVFPAKYQDISIAGKRAGINENTRSGLVFEAIKIIDHFKPNMFIFENVEALLSIDNGNSIETIFEELSRCGYALDFDVFNTKEVLPQARSRVYGIGIRLNLCEKLESGLYVRQQDSEREDFKQAIAQSQYQLSLFGNTQQRESHYYDLVRCFAETGGGEREILSIQKGDKNVNQKGFRGGNRAVYD